MMQEQQQNFSMSTYSQGTGLPIEIVSDQGVHFINEVIEFLLEEFMVIHRKFAPYHPQAKWPSGEYKQSVMHSFDKSC